MKKLTIFILFISLSHFSFSQEMTQKKLGDILTSVSDTISGNGRQWQFIIKDTHFMCLTDSTHNRMRIITPITEAIEIDEATKTAMLNANFHTALDVKYAISGDVVWSAFIHPLKELTEEQALDAISQVYYAKITFGTTFSSTSLAFPGKKPKKELPQKETKELIKKI